jgi:hypothetical protein
MNHLVTGGISALVVALLFVRPRPTLADDQSDRVLKAQIAAPTRDEMIIDNALNAAMADLNEAVFVKLDSDRAKQMMDRRQKKFETSDLIVLCAYRGNAEIDAATINQSKCLLLKRLWTLTYFQAFQQLLQVYARGRNDALVPSQ